MTRSLFRAMGAAILLAVSFGAAAQLTPRFEQLEAQLRIRPEQKQQYDLAVAATQRALLAVAMAAIQIKERLAQELMKPRPDFSSLARAHEEIIDQTRPLFREARDEWKRLIDILDDEQVDIVRRYLRDHLNRLLTP